MHCLCLAILALLVGTLATVDGVVDRDTQLDLTGADCHYDTSKRRCMGPCSALTDDKWCVEYQPGQCGCKACEYDYYSNACVGACHYPYTCVLSGDRQCECARCGWSSTKKDACLGICNSPYMCGQTTETGPCQCTKDTCFYEFASGTCKGVCQSGTRCQVDRPGHCTCSR
ncbi:hypothetical protein KIPB_001417 [Kipferlia bialata]|uniref:Uncharacterized protein n=1 Tax=Kipferlia bialata TaxID=797122 RepID=A0A9K3GFY0_9EUKA|nr:hypothetical protein KIPB_001417 [Kipferlia bialata]|eukprot:g1417.t1